MKKINGIVLLFLVFSISMAFHATGSSETELPAPEDVLELTISTHPEVLYPGEFGRLIIHGKLKEGWKVYSIVPSKEKDALIPTSLKIEEPNGNINWVDGFRENKSIKAFDKVIGLTLSYHKTEVYFYRDFQLNKRLHSDLIDVPLSITYQLCNESICLPPHTRLLQASISVGSGNPRPEFLSNRHLDGGVPKSGLDQKRLTRPLWEKGLIPFIILAIGAGMISLLTPCVFPMVPITVSYFSYQEKPVKLAISFALSIIFTYTIAGLIISVLFGAAGISRFAVNPYVNLSIAALFLVLGVSMMGGFDFYIPIGLANSVDQAARRAKGYTAPMLMGAAFTLTAFTCTAQFAGSLLVAASRGNWIWPVIGMLVFSITFSTPFFILAVSPNLMQKWRSFNGDTGVMLKWLVGILEVGAALKYISNSGIIWGLPWVDRRFLIVCWALISVISACYLARKSFFKSGQHEIGLISRFFKLTGSGVFLILSIYLMTGLKGDLLHPMIESFLPPSLNEFASNGNNLDHPGDRVNWLPDVDSVQAEAKNSNRPIFLEFTGYTCINCRYMEQTILTKPDVTEILKNYVLGKLYTDGGIYKGVNSTFQQNNFSTLALPFYCIMRSDGEIVASRAGLVTKTEFKKFLLDNLEKIDNSIKK